MKKKPKHELLTLMNVGPASCEFLLSLGINSIKKLASQEPDALFTRLEKNLGCKENLCVWDVFAATIHEAKTGVKQPWWVWSEKRMARQAKIKFLKNH